MRLTAGGKQLEAEIIPGRNAEAPPIVMLHEGLGSLALWRDVPQRLAAQTGSAVLVYSRYGYGRSEMLHERRDPDYMHHEAIVVLPELLAAVNLRRPVLFGHSDGASIALIHAGAFPDAVAGLVLEAPHVFVEELSIESIARAKCAYENGPLRRKLASWHDDPDATFYGWNDIWLDPRFRRWNIEASLSTIRCPVLVLQGSEDEYGTLAQVDAICTATPDTKALVIEGAGHNVHRDASDAVVAATVSFLGVRPKTSKDASLRL